MKEVGRKYVFNRKGGKESIIERAPVFCPDGESIVVILENKLRVYNVQTGDCTRSLEAENNEINCLIGVEFPDDDEANLYACSDCGYIIIWTWEQGAVLKETKLSATEQMQITSFNVLNRNECLVTGKRFNDLNVCIYNMKSGELVRTFYRPKLKYNPMISVAVGNCKGEKFAAIAYGTDKLHIQHLSQPNVHLFIKNYNKIRIMCVAAHKKKGILAITDALGIVTIIRGNLFCQQEVEKAAMHWHFLPVFATCFSIRGSYLYSGGMEKVAVKWTLRNLANKCNERQVIPRLPGIIRYITASRSHVAISLSNNSVVIADGQMRVSSTLRECGGMVAGGAGPPPALHAPLAALLTPARSGHLQLVSTNTNQLIYNIDITETNSLPAERYNLMPEETAITCYAVSANGGWLVTSEYRSDGVNYPEEKLKFWAFKQNATSAPFSLNTCVNLSHGGCKVICIVLDTKGKLCISSGEDQRFRIWKRQKVARHSFSWECLTVCYYSSGSTHFLEHKVLNMFKNQEHAKIVRGEQYPYLREQDESVEKNDILGEIFNMHKRQTVPDCNTDSGDEVGDEIGGVDISSDGSLIAAWFGCKLTLWDTHLCTLRTTLSHLALRPKGIDVKFGNGDAAHYVVCTSANCVAVWSLLSLSMMWMVPLKASCLVADPFSNKMAVATHDNDVYVFSPHDSSPVMVKKCVLPPTSGIITRGCFGIADKNDFRIYFTQNNSEIYCLEPEEREEGDIEALSRRDVVTSQFGALLAEQQVSDVRAAAAPDSATPAHRPATALAQVLSGAPHMMPPLSLLTTSFLEQLTESIDLEKVEAVDDVSIKEQSADSEDDSDEYAVDKLAMPKAAQLWTQNFENVKIKSLKKIINEPLLEHDTTKLIFKNKF